MAEAAAGAPAPVDVPTTSARAVLAYDTTGDGHLDAFDINQDGQIDVRTADLSPKSSVSAPPSPLAPTRSNR